jgi:hypothetical protein
VLEVQVRLGKAYFQVFFEGLSLSFEITLILVPIQTMDIFLLENCLKECLIHFEIKCYWKLQTVEIHSVEEVVVI